MADNTQFGRKYRVLVSVHGDTAIDVSDLRCTFKIEKVWGGKLTQAGEITIFNLNAKLENDIIFTAAAGGNVQVMLEAGYEGGNYGVIFRGDLIQPIRYKEDAVTYALKLICSDSDNELNSSFVNFTLANGQTASQVAAQTARNSTVPFQLNQDKLSEQKSERAMAVFGMAKDVLRSIAVNNNSVFYFDDGQANISNVEKEPVVVEAIKLNAQTGMIDMPKQNNGGVDLRCLINPQIKLGNFVLLNNRDILVEQLEIGSGQYQTLLDMDGLYRVIKYTITGDTRGNDWYYDLKTITQAGKLPVMLQDPEFSGV